MCCSVIELFTSSSRWFWKLLTRIFRHKRNKISKPVTFEPLNGSTSAEDNFGLKAMVGRLVKYRILRHNSPANHYTIHPLIRAYYLERLNANQIQAKSVHENITKYYLFNQVITNKANLLDYIPSIEAVYHSCQSGTYHEALSIFTKRRIFDGVALKLGAYEIVLALLLEFFPNGDITQEPHLWNLKDKSYLFNVLGLCLMYVGRIREAITLYERKNAITLSQNNWESASIGYGNLAELYTYLGRLSAGADSAHQALRLARRAASKEQQRNSLTEKGWVAYLQGKLEEAGDAFQKAQVLEREIDRDQHYLYSLRGIWHAHYLRRIGNADYARIVTEANLRVCDRSQWRDHSSLCHRILGDLDADALHHDLACQQYNKAVAIAQKISYRPSLIEALLARGYWAARQGEVEAARTDLDEALSYAVTSGYRIYEADIRVGLAWAHLADGHLSAARTEAERAQRMSAEMSYHWGQVDAVEALAALD